MLQLVEIGHGRTVYRIVTDVWWFPILAGMRKWQKVKDTSDCGRFRTKEQKQRVVHRVKEVFGSDRRV
jgi:hypothetical protein